MATQFGVYVTPGSWSAPPLRRFVGRAPTCKGAAAAAHSKTCRILAPSRLLSTLWGVASLLTSVAAGAIPIISNGSSHPIIILGKDAGPLDRLAGSELQGYLEKLTGARINQITESEAASVAKGDTILLLGTASQNYITRELADTGAINSRGLKPEGFALK